MPSANSNIKKPISASNKSSMQTAKSNSSFFSQIYEIITGTLTPKSQVVKVRLINSWSDVTLEKIDIVLKNFLYDENSFWQEIERTTRFKREHLFYGGSAFLAFIIFNNHFISTLILLFSIVLPTICTLHSVNSNDPNQQIYWLKYWILFGSFTILEYCVNRVYPSADLDYLKLAALLAAFLPYISSMSLLFDMINGPFVKASEKLDQYNFQLVA